MAECYTRGPLWLGDWLVELVKIKMILTFKFQSQAQHADEKTREKSNFHSGPVCRGNAAVATCLLQTGQSEKKNKTIFVFSVRVVFLSGLTGTPLSTRSHLAPITIDRRHLRADWRRPMSMFLFNFGDIKIVLFFVFCFSNARKRGNNYVQHEFNQKNTTLE